MHQHSGVCEKMLCARAARDIMTLRRFGSDNSEKEGRAVENFGFIHGELDTKILILYVLRRLPRPVDTDTLAYLCSFDNGVGWFDFAAYLADLVETGHVQELSGGRYLITEKGSTNGEAAETSIPYSVRMKADKLLEPVADRMRRDAMIDAEHEPNKAGGVTVKLSLSDGKGEVPNMHVLAPDDATAEVMEKTFRTDAEQIYQRITQILIEG